MWLRTYCYTEEDRFEKRIILSEELEDVGIGGYVDEDDQRILSYSLAWLKDQHYIASQKVKTDPHTQHSP